MNPELLSTLAAEHRRDLSARGPGDQGVIAGRVSWRSVRLISTVSYQRGRTFAHATPPADDPGER
jgi:hypothetical protein